MIGFDWFPFDGNGNPNFGAAVRGTGVSYAYVRADFSIWADDYDLGPGVKRASDMLDDIERAGLVAGAYCMPDYRIGAAPAVDQIQTFSNAAKLRPGRLPIILDLELGGGGVAGTGRTRLQLADFVHELIVQASVAFPRTRVIVYSSRRVCDDVDSDCLGGAATGAMRDVDWFVARYPYAARVDAQIHAADMLPAPPVPTAAGDVDNWLDHQFQGDAIRVAGFPGAVDVNRWNPMTARTPDGVRRQRHMRLLANALGARATGVFTADAIAFQRDHGLVDDAIIGPRTFAWLAWCHSVSA